MRRTKEEAEATRETILNTALRVFSTKGYTATTLKDIAEEAGVTRGAIYWHFSGKADLYSALVSERFEVANQVFSEVYQQGGTPLQILERLMIRALEYVEEDAEYRAVLDLTWFKTEVTPDIQDMMKYKVQGTRSFIESLEQLIVEGVRNGEIKGTTDAKNAAIAAVGLFSGVISTWMLDPGFFSLKEQAAGIVAAFLNGLKST